MNEPVPGASVDYRNVREPLIRRSLTVIQRRPLLVLIAISAFLLLIASLFPSLITSQPTTGLFMSDALQPPSKNHLFGTDEAGRDIFTRVIFGARVSLGMALGIVAIGALFGTLYGAVAGFLGGRSDELMMRIVDVFLAFPTFVLAMAVAAAAGRGVLSVVIALAIIWWPSYARLIRGMVLSIKESVWVESALAVGAPTHRIIFRHILPFTSSELNVRVTVDIGYALVAVTSLSFIGLGAQRPTPEWGLLIADGRQYVTSAWWYPIFPGIAIYVSTLVFTLLGDALADQSSRTRQK